MKQKNRQKTHKKQYSCNVLTECDNSKMTSITQRAKTREKEAEKIGVSPSTLYRHHNKLQKENASKSDGLPKLYNYTV